MVTKISKGEEEGEKVFYLRITETTLKTGFPESSLLKRTSRRVASVVALLSLFAELLFLKTSQEVFCGGAV